MICIPFAFALFVCFLFFVRVRISGRDGWVSDGKKTVKSLTKILLLRLFSASTSIQYTQLLLYDPVFFLGKHSMSSTLLTKKKKEKEGKGRYIKGKKRKKERTGMERKKDKQYGERI